MKKIIKTKIFKRFLFSFFILSFVLNSCATYETGPKVREEEIKKEAALLKQKAQQYRVQQLQRVINISI